MQLRHYYIIIVTALCGFCCHGVETKPNSQEALSQAECPRSRHITVGHAPRLQEERPYGPREDVDAATPHTEGDNSAATVITLGEVAVTAIKGGGQLGDAQDATTTITRGEIERLNIANIKQITAIAPNVYMPQYGSRMTSTVYVRGLGARIDQPVVGLNVDNVPIVNKDNFDFDMADIAAIEVLRGPQNILYGRNTMAGLINIYTLSPLNYEGVRAGAGYGTQGTYRAWAGIYQKLGADLGMSLTASATGTDGFWRNSYNDTPVGRERTWSGRWKTAYRPRSNVMVENAAWVSHSRQNGYPYQSVKTGRIDYNDTCYYRRTSVFDGLTVKHNLERVAFSSILSFQYIDDDMTLDQDFLPDSYFNITQRRKEWAVTADFVARGHAGNYRWLGGLYGFGRRGSMHAPVTFLDDGISRLIEAHRNEAIPEYPVRWDTRRFVLGSEFRTPSGGASAYHESEVRLGGWTLTLGLRLDWERTSLRYRSHTKTSYSTLDLTGAEPAVLSQTPVDIDDSDAMTDDYVQLLPRLSASYQMGCGNAFLSVAKGYKAGGFNTQMFSDVLQQRLMNIMGMPMLYDADEVVSYAPEKNWTMEGGVHLNFLERRLTVDGTLFWIECRDQQISVFPEGSTTGRMMTNAGRTRSRGVELQGAYAMPCGLTMRASWGFTDARFRRYNNGREDFGGRRVPYAPANTLMASASWSRRMPGRWVEKLEIGASVRGAGKIYWDEANSLSQPFYATMDANIRADHGPWSVEVWATNITDTQYNTFYFVSIGNAFLQRANGFQIGATLRLNLETKSH